MSTRKVKIISGNYQYNQMFQHNGWEVVDELEEADLVQFTGGEDVSPESYGEMRHPYTNSSHRRDELEARVFKLAKTWSKPMAGICRGGQFLNVMCGGRMYQHVNNHAIGGTHLVINVETGGMMNATSTHHQMMRAGENAEVVGIASEATLCEHMEGGEIKYHTTERGTDVEVLFYKEDKALCFQPHPEYMDVNSPCQKWYFNLIESKFFNNEEA